VSDRIFESAVRWALTIVAGIVLGCTASSGAFAQSCYNNSNPNLIQNGGFENGSVGQTIPDWNVKWHGKTNTGKLVDPYLNVGNDNPHSGSQELDMGTTLGTNDIYQPITTTVAADVYTVCFWLASAPDPSVGKTSIEVLWNDVSELELIQSATSPYQYYSFTVVGTGADHLRFRERNDKGYYYLDDVALQLCSGCTAGHEFKKQ
jgi:hypothetical protein